MRMKKALSYISLVAILPLLTWLVHERERPGSTIAGPYDLSSINTPGDVQGSITINWFRIPGDQPTGATATAYRLLRSTSKDGQFTEIASIDFGQPGPSQQSRQFRDTTAVLANAYFYKVISEPEGTPLESNIAGPVTSVAQSSEAGATAMLDEILFPPTQLRAFDTPNDDGRSITLEWKISPNDVPKSGQFNGYEIYRRTTSDGPFEMVGDATGGETDLERHVKIFGDGHGVKNGVAYYYYVEAKFNGQRAKSNVAGPVKAREQWFHTGRAVSLVLLGILIASILYFINQAKAGKKLFIRKIAGLEAVDEAVGRATEMGKKVFYIPGTQDMDNVQTIAGLTILARVARLTAEYETKLEVPVAKSLVMITAREVVKEAYLNVGRSDFYSDDMVYYLTDDQFGYAAGIDGLVVRQKPATIFYQGAFYAESLILAETGNSIGAIQIAGTAMPAQLPFFVAACDYTLIGEELFAASAYLSREPKLLGSLKGQDIGGKLVFLSLAIVIIIIVTVAAFSSPDMISQVTKMFEVH